MNLRFIDPVFILTKTYLCLCHFENQAIGTEASFKLLHLFLDNLIICLQLLMQVFKHFSFASPAIIQLVLSSSYLTLISP